MIPIDALLSAYASGWFPMAIAPGEIRWYSPDPRGVIPLDTFHVPSRLRRTLRQRRFEIRIDTCFVDVMRACGDPSREDGWITAEFIEAYTALHRLGWAHSVEVFDREQRLAGGL